MSQKVLDITAIAEDHDLEVKKAGGADGRGEVPRNFWETYSAMANTEGGIVLLGVEEKPKYTYTARGIKDVEKVRKVLWDGANNREIISANLISNNMVEVVNVDGLSVIQVTIPRALRHQRPIYVGDNPLTGTYRRCGEGDYRCDEHTVRRMLAESVEDSRDSRLLEGFNFDDLDAETLKIYRTHFKVRAPDHPWNDQTNEGFLQSIGGWTVDRQTGKAGLTLAGLLMFGRLRPILDAVPNYVVDYIERPGPRTDKRWVDRVTIDGTWSGNLYDFYRLVIRKLYAGLKVPFKLANGQRLDDTPVHNALREAMVNTLIHADYTDRVPLRVVMRPDLFEFRNPGTMRLPIEEALRGGTSGCRNRNLQKMFQSVGFGEQAGSGIPKIYKTWKSQQWRTPQLQERFEPDQTVLTMRLVSLLPDGAIKSLERRFRDFGRLSENKRLALVTVKIEGEVTHAKLKDITTAHSRDLTDDLRWLVKKGYLASDGNTRGTRYFFPGEQLERERMPLFSMGPVSITLPNPSITDTNPSITGDEAQQEETGVSQEQLLSIASPAHEKKRLQPDVMQALILRLCARSWLTPKKLSQLLKRRPNSLPLWSLKEKGLLEARHPDQHAHPDQRYRTSEAGKQWLVQREDQE